MDFSAADLTQWTKERIDAECSRSYQAYERGLQTHYTNYFQAHPQLRCPRHRYSARTIAAALPPGHSDLQKRIPKGSLHRFARSGRSSQLLALGLLGSAAEQDDSLRWFWDAANLPGYASHRQRPSIRFEHCLAPSDLGEAPRVTKVDLTIASEDTFVAVETKWSEPGLGVCSCVRDGDGDPRPGSDCAVRVRSRKAYWETARDLFDLGGIRLSFFPCSLSVAYQAVRNVAAARHLSRGRRSVFVLIHDETNPFFQRCGDWPGWPDMLNGILRKHARSSFFFQAVSWQSLISNLPLTPQVRRWAREKHRL